MRAGGRLKTRKPARAAARATPTLPTGGVEEHGEPDGGHGHGAAGQHVETVHQVDPVDQQQGDRHQADGGHHAGQVHRAGHHHGDPDGHLTGHPHERRQVEPVVGHAEGRGRHQGDGQRGPVRQDGHQHAGQDGHAAQVGHGCGLLLQRTGAVEDAGAVGDHDGQGGEDQGDGEGHHGQTDHAHPSPPTHCMTSDRVPGWSSNSASAANPHDV